MALSRMSGAAMEQTMRLLGSGQPAELAIRQAAWVARCVGRGETAPLSQGDVSALAATLRTRTYERLAGSQSRILGLLGRSLTEQVARLLLEESVDSGVRLPQRTLAAMLGVQRPSLNKILKEFERQGLLTVGYAAIHLVDRSTLLKVAGQG